MATGERIGWYSLLALVILMPLSIGNLQVYGIPTGSILYDQFDLVKLTVTRVLCIIGCLGLLWAYTMEDAIPRISSITRFYLLFIVLALLSTILSISPETALFGKYRRYEGLLTYLLYGMAFLMAFQLADSPKRVRTVALCLIGSGTVVALYGIAQYLGSDPITWGSLGFESNRAFSTYGNPNMLGSFILFPLVLSFALAYGEERTRLKIVLWICALINTAACFATFTRASWIAALLGLVALAVIAWRRRVAPSGIDTVFLVTIAAVLLIAIIVSMITGAGVMDFGHRILSMFDLDSGSTSSRLEIWSAAVEAIKKRPLLGWGADTFRQIFPLYKPFSYSSTVSAISVADNAHNNPLHLMAGVGIPATIAIYAFFLTPLLMSRWIVRQGPPALLAFYILVPVYLLNMMMGLSLVGTTTLLYIALGVVLAPASRNGRTLGELMGDGSSLFREKVRLGIAITGIVLSVIALAGTLRYAYADRVYLLAQRAPLVERAEAMERVLTLNPTNDRYRSRYGYTLLAVYNDDPSEAAYHEAEEALLEIIDSTPYEFDNVLFLVSLYNTRGNTGDAQAHSRALDLAQQSVAKWPHTAPMRVQYALALERDGQLELAHEQITFALALDPDYQSALFYANHFGMDVTP